MPAWPTVRPALVTPAEDADARQRDDRAGWRLVNLRAGLLVHEGGLFGQQQERAVSRDYGQSAIIAHVQASSPIAHRAYERFTDEGPLALLPQDDGYALVWCAAHARNNCWRSTTPPSWRAWTPLSAAASGFTHTTPRLAFRWA
jgi:2-octaprenyl-6-methoxyphenol hydroxylase